MRSTVRRSLLSQFVLSLTVITFITYPAICIKGNALPRNHKFLIFFLVLEMFDCSVEVGDKLYLNADP